MIRLATCWVLPAAALASAPSYGDALERLIEATRTMHREAREAQQTIDALGGHIDEAAKADTWAEASLASAIAALEARTGAQAFEIAWLEDQLAGLDDIDGALLPLLARMTDALAQLLALDLPFRVAERRDAIERLRSGLSDPGLGIDERVRRVFAAWQRELDYGRSTEVYADWVSLPRPARAKVLRVGRVALYYLTPDGTRAGWWDHGARDWRALSHAQVVLVRDAVAATAKASLRGDTPPPMALPLPPPPALR